VGLSKQLHLLLAPKERFEPDGAGAFALNVLETSRVSRFRSNITVFGSPVAQPFDEVRFHPLAKARWFEGDRNRAMVRRYFQYAKHNPPDLIEIYNRPMMIDLLHRPLATVPLALHIGNDPRKMDGSRSTSERRNLLEKAAAIVCVSAFIRNCFFEGIDDSTNGNVHIVHNGVERATVIPPKENRIVYVGRIVPEKGVLELVRALARVLPMHPAWMAEIIGARWFGKGEEPSAYEKSVVRAASGCGQIVLAGFRPHAEVLAALRPASIAVVPSLWDEPLSRTAPEAVGQGCALVCSSRGGLPELGADRALYLNSISEQSIAEAIEHLICHGDERRALQRRGWENLPFEIHRITALLDGLRDSLINKSSS